ncbi:acyltransferase [Bacillus sp. AG4(2022)]|uniref:acyltransferase n=1 Tax=Bacillus sp. AG4(2022) TaxID=2962594 RepID=UPI00288221B7|nr:acyltransferase [Bacillus sp. AG4(2022)]MDT0161596.1 acyltransferase [Bacillus sp. AG4(2022)]
MNLKRLTRAIVCLPFTFLKFCLMKIFNGNRFKFHYLELFSPLSEVSISKGGVIKLGKLVRAQSGTRIRARENATLIIGKNTAFNTGCVVTCRYNIKIGEGVEFGPNVLIYDHDHDFRIEGGIKAKSYKYGNVEIGNNVWIGANTVILRGTKIGDNSVVGAGSIIRGEYPANSIIVQKRQTEVKPYKTE